MPAQHTEIIVAGDCGAVRTDGTDPVLNAIKTLLPTNAHSAVVFLGDNIYPEGMPEAGSPDYPQAEAILLAQLQSVENFAGTTVFLSGNHDWRKGKPGGLEAVERQEAYINTYFGGRKVFLPESGSPGPVEINLSKEVCLVLIDTHCWLFNDPKLQSKTMHAAADHRFFTDLEAILARNTHRRVVIAGHLPVYSYALHGGRFKLKHHIFPLTVYHKRWFVPLPVIGSLLPYFRKYIGAKEDFAHPRYRRFRHAFLAVLEKFNNIIYASGHEHNLQYITRNGNHFIVSGAGSKLKYVTKGKYSQFALKRKGFFKVLVSAGGLVTLQAFRADEAGTVKVYDKRII